MQENIVNTPAPIDFRKALTSNPFSIIAEKHEISSTAHGQKAFFYLGGLTEGTETIIFYIIICLFPEHFPILAVVFGGLCWITVVGRFGSAYSLLR